MPIQEHRTIAFHVAREQQNLRLLEFPPALLECVTSQHPSSLLLKSTASTEAAPGHAVLCSSDQTFQLRQVNSSNSVFLLQPSTIATATGEASSTEGLTAVAKCEATLEVIPQTIACYPLLKRVLPVFSDLDGKDVPSSIDIKSRQAIFEDIPVSSREFDRAWNDLCAVEDEGRAYRPSPAVQWKAWASIVSACTLKGLSLDRELDVVSLARTVEEDDVPAFVLDAVMERLRSDAGVPQQSVVKIDAAKSIRWTGTVLLESRTEDDNPLSLVNFLRDWKDHLPESWRQHATVDTLKGSFTQPSKDTIMFAENENQAGEGISSVVTAKVAGPQARKWHERFKNTRR